MKKNILFILAIVILLYLFINLNNSFANIDKNFEANENFLNYYKGDK